jgi:hypothetical protein
VIIATAANSVYNQLLYVPVRAFKVSFPTNMVGLGQLIQVSVSRYKSGTEDATGHTRGRCELLQFFIFGALLIYGITFKGSQLFDAVLHFKVSKKDDGFG